MQKAQQISTRAAFFIPGFVIACWAPLVPFAKARASLDEATLGMVLLCLGMGSLLAMPMSGMFAARHGCRRVMLAMVAAMLLALPLLAVVSTPLSLGLVLLVFGGAIGAMDCVMNIQAVVVERESGRSMMSGFHAFYSIGSLAGALVVSMLLQVGITPLLCTVTIAAIALAIAGSFMRAWRTDRVQSGAPLFALPRGIVVLVGLVCFVTFLAEGSMLDWSAVFLHEVREIDLAHAGWGFVAFNSAMTVTRLLGDRVVERLGHAKAVLVGGLGASTGLAVATLSPNLGVSLAGFALLGVGCANIVPVMFTLAGKQTRIPESLAIPAITTMGYAGILLGPAVIGFISQGWSLSAAFLLTALVLAGASVMGSLLRIR
ncbi:MAG: MFS transporter [Propionivibrio sp.]